MKNKIILLVTAVIIVIAFIIGAVLINYNASSFALDNKKEDNVVITLKNASTGAGGFGYITIKDGQKLNIKSNLSDKGTLEVEVFAKKDTKNKSLVHQTFKGKDSHKYELAAGEYILQVTVSKKGATGTMKVTAEKED